MHIVGESVVLGWRYLIYIIQIILQLYECIIGIFYMKGPYKRLLKKLVLQCPENYESVWWFSDVTGIIYAILLSKRWLSLILTIS